MIAPNPMAPLTTPTPPNPFGIKSLRQLLAEREALVGKILATPHDDGHTCDALINEAEIVWVGGFDPASRRYVRETVATWCGRRRGPLRYRGFRVVGWSNLYPDAPNNGAPGRFTRRLLWLKEYDAGECDSGPYQHTGAPSEGVDPLTVFPQSPGQLTERAWGTHTSRGAKS